ncbi:MAG: lytic transglycosylase domain-containing protein [Jatrophihabitantaceae bacterium]
MSHPRYAPAGFQFSLRGTLFSITVLMLGALLGLPAVSRAATKQAAPPAAAQAGQAAGIPAGSGRTDAQAAAGLGPIVIHPLPVSTNQPAQPVSVIDGVFGPAADMGQLGIPAMALRAYRLAAAQLAVEQPACHLPWWLLAGIGHTESGHAESGRLYADGTTRGRILGPVLDGTLADNAVITDTDHGFYDGDPVFDRAVGPMQFIPSTWVHWAADGNHDGKRDPNNIFDATVAAGRYLCADGRNLATLPGLQAAVLSYNHSQAYLDTVLAWGLAYRNGAAAVADVNAPVINDVTKVRPPLTARPPKKPQKIAPTSSASASPSAATSGSQPASADSGSSAATPGSSAAASSSAPASASPTASCTSSAVPSGTVTISAGTAAQSASSQAAAPASSADGGSATAGVVTSGSVASTDPQSSAATPAPTGCAR